MQALVFGAPHQVFPELMQRPPVQQTRFVTSEAGGVGLALEHGPIGIPNLLAGAGKPGLFAAPEFPAQFTRRPVVRSDELDAGFSRGGIGQVSRLRPVGAVDKGGDVPLAILGTPSKHLPQSIGRPSVIDEARAVVLQACVVWIAPEEVPVGCDDGLCGLRGRVHCRGAPRWIFCKDAKGGRLAKPCSVLPTGQFTKIPYGRAQLELRAQESRFREEHKDRISLDAHGGDAIFPVISFRVVQSSQVTQGRPR